jgi:putative intracellular protease/amidase
MIKTPVYDDVDLLDVTGPFEMFRWAGLDVLVVDEKSGPVVCNGGSTLQIAAPIDCGGDLVC